LAAKITAIVIFSLACVTDALDGFLAKRNNQVTDFGKLMDPVADKILVLSAFLAFVEMGIVAAWMVIVIIFREVIVTTLRIMALSKGNVIPADTSGRHKTVWQMASIFIILIYLILNEGGRFVFTFWTEEADLIYRNTIYAIMLVVVMLTLGSGILCLFKNWRVIKDAKTD
jgi:CDP-diacylglycerol--glycerol-3-phosphate 3-phosphatidyltransferase